jgi:VanZ family protein
MFDEVFQYFTPTRIPDIFDVIMDIFGGLTGAYIRKYF